MRSSSNGLRRAAGRLTVATTLAAVALGLSGAPARAALTITVTGPSSLGSRQVGGGGLAARLGTVTVTSDAPISSWTASVSSTNCTTGTGSAAYQRVARASLSYWSGPATATTGLLSVVSPGQATAANALTLGASRTAFSATTASLGTSSVSWRPTITVTIPTNVIVGTYTCTVTHSVA